jgi:hypothetical protein
MDLKIPPRGKIFRDLSNEAYHGHHESYSKSSLVDFADRPLKLMQKRKYSVQGKIKTTSIFDLGTAAHTALLELDKWEDRTIVQPKSIKRRHGKDWDEFQNLHDDKTILTQKQSEDLTEMVAGYERNKLAMRLLQGGYPEVSVFWWTHWKWDNFERQFVQCDEEDAQESYLLKARPDYLPGNQIVIDLKTLTLDGLTRVTGHEHKEYFFVCLEKTPPYDCAVYQCPDDLVNRGREEIAALLPYLAECIHNNEWPGMPDEILEPVISGWFWRR